MHDAEGGGSGARTTKRQMAAERSRKAILDAAEELFAEKGYENTSLREVGEAAGLSRGTPAYFFGSKEGLYRAVLERAFEDAGALIAGADANLLGPEHEESKSPEEGLSKTLGPYIDFLASRPSYVALAEREALGRARDAPGEEGGEGGEGRFPPVIAMLGGTGVEKLANAMGSGRFRQAEPSHLAASIIALCSYPFMLGGGLVRTLGIEPDDPAFVEEWKRHVVDLLVHGIFVREGPGPSDPLAGREEGDREQGERPEEEAQ